MHIILSGCYFKKLFFSRLPDAPLSLAIRHLKVSMLTREVVASNHHLKIVIARAISAKPRFKTRPAGFYPWFLIGADLDGRLKSARSVITRTLIHLQDERAQPSRGPRDDAECHRGHLYTADYEHADSQHDQQTLHRQRTEVWRSDLINFFPAISLTLNSVKHVSNLLPASLT